jgi:serine/threonine protein kinase
MDSFHEQMEEYSFPYYEPKDIKLKNNIGEGGTGTVYKGTLTIFDDTIDCIVKQVSSDNYDESNRNRMMYQDIIDEVKIGHRFMSKSKYLIQFYGYTVFEKDDNVIIYLLMEDIGGEDFSKYLNSKEYWKRLSKSEYDKSNSKTKMYHDEEYSVKYWDYTLPVKEKLKMIKLLCLAVQELHSLNIVHCDFKLNNTLYTGKRVKIIDFGASFNMRKHKVVEGPGEMGTPGYMAKEMDEGWISYQGDIYSLGVCILEIWFGDIWPTDTNDYKKCRKYVLDYLHLLKKDNIDLYKLIKKCVSTEYTKRPLIKTVLSNLQNIHP